MATRHRSVARPSLRSRTAARSQAHIARFDSLITCGRLYSQPPGHGGNGWLPLDANAMRPTRLAAFVLLCLLVSAMMVIAAVLRFPTAAVALGLGRRYDRGADSGLRASCPVVKRLTETLSHYVAADDGTLSRLELLAAVRDRIRDDLKAANRILAGQRPICGCGRPGRSLVLSWTVSSSRSQKVDSRKRPLHLEFASANSAPIRDWSSVRINRYSRPATCSSMFANAPGNACSSCSS